MNRIPLVWVGQVAAVMAIGLAATAWDAGNAAILLPIVAPLGVALVLYRMLRR